MRAPVLETKLANLPVRRGKVRDIYDLGDRLLLVGTDRISAFDWILPSGIPDKGRVLTQISSFWFDRLGEPHHLLTHRRGTWRACRPTSIRAPLAGRSMLVRKTDVVPIECVVRGYLSGSGWKEYQKTQSVCGIALPAGLTRKRPAARADLHARHQGRERPRRQHLVRADGRASSGANVAEELRRRSLAVYRPGREYARTKGIIIADTKFEWGRLGDDLILIDEVLTPDSSRFWPAGPLPAGRRSAVVRQAVRPRLAGDDQLGQEQPAARSCPTRSSCAHATSTSRPTSD